MDVRLIIRQELLHQYPLLCDQLLHDIEKHSGLSIGRVNDRFSKISLDQAYLPLDTCADVLFVNRCSVVQESDHKEKVKREKNHEQDDKLRQHAQICPALLPVIFHVFQIHLSSLFCFADLACVRGGATAQMLGIEPVRCIETHVPLFHREITCFH
jgi:hypothetical protein